MDRSTNFQLKVMTTVYYEIGLEEVTTKRQRAKGTMMFKDLQFDHIYYTFHKSGYFRRRVMTRSGYPAFMTGRDYEHYQLNRVKRIERHANGFHRVINERILIKDIPHQMLLATSAIANFRKNNKNV